MISKLNTMRDIILYLFTILFLSFGTNQKTYAQLSRGAHPGELYISSGWYIDNNGHWHFAIFHSDNNGENLTLKYETVEIPPSDEMKVGTVLGDATPGALYNYGNNELWLSYDHVEIPPKLST